MSLPSIAIVVMALLTAPLAAPATDTRATVFTGDFETGDFSQYLTCQTVAYNGRALD